MKVAIVHDFLTQRGGAEKVVEVLHDMFPQAPVYTSVYDAHAMPAAYRDWDIRTSFIQRFLVGPALYRAALLLYPMAFESFDLSGYDLVISSSSSFAKGVLTRPETVHVCYTHTPMRYAWQMRGYVENERLSRVARAILAPSLHYLRTWDAVAASRVDHYIANSSVVAERIRKYYRRESHIICPPVETTRFKPRSEASDYYVVVSRLIPYKRLDLAVSAFSHLGLPLKVVGTGRQAQALRRLAGPTIEFMGFVDDGALPELVAGAKALVMPGEEDFGIAPVEANACGRPVIAYAAGGALDSQVDGVTGVLFNQPTVESLCAAIKRFEASRFDSEAIRRNAQSFDKAVFRQRISEFLETVVPHTRQPRLRCSCGDRTSADLRELRQLQDYPHDAVAPVGADKNGASSAIAEPLHV
jgi:glycosyltransferase involved in cell wall biosynthesis